jgi:HAD superfamily hydrolase (TIGR01509 family)
MDRKPVTFDFSSTWSTAASFLFDFDGVLADSEPLFRRSWNIAFEPWGHCISKQDYWKYWSSLGEGLEGEIMRYGLEGIDIPRVRKRQKETYEGFVNDGMVPLFPNAARLLEMLSSRDKFFRRPYCIASNTPFSLVRKILIAGGASVPLIVGGDKLEKKPSPDIFLRAASLIGCSPSSTLVFEDSWKGVTAAERGGFVSVLVLNQYNRNFDIKSEFVIDGIQKLIDIIAGGSMQ